MINPHFNALVCHTGDADIKYMLAQHAISLDKPDPPNDLAICQLKDSGFVWLVFRHFNPADPGYVAYGLPESTSKEDRGAVWTAILEHIWIDGKERGIDVFRESKISVQSLEVN
jgi:hypothetical protein